jgi:hypothetical protein
MTYSKLYLGDGGMVLASRNLFYYDVTPQLTWINERVGDHEHWPKDDIHVICTVAHTIQFAILYPFI